MNNSLLSIGTALVLTLMFSAPSNAQAEGWRTPKPGTPERQAIMNAVRHPVQKQLRQEVIFVVEHLRVDDTWAFMLAEPRQPKNRPVNWTIGDYAEDYKLGIFDPTVISLLKKSKDGGWEVIALEIGATDIPYVEWDSHFGVPRAILGLPPKS